MAQTTTTTTSISPNVNPGRMPLPPNVLPRGSLSGTPLTQCGKFGARINNSLERYNNVWLKEVEVAYSRLHKTYLIHIGPASVQRYQIFPTTQGVEVEAWSVLHHKRSFGLHFPNQIPEFEKDIGVHAEKLVEQQVQDYTKYAIYETGDDRLEMMEEVERCKVSLLLGKMVVLATRTCEEVWKDVAEGVLESYNGTLMFISGTTWEFAYEDLARQNYILKDLKEGAGVDTSISQTSEKDVGIQKGAGTEGGDA